MTQDVDLSRQFTAKNSDEQQKTVEVPERIKKHKPEPVLKPDGSWRARADALDRTIYEGNEAKKAKSDWAKRIDQSLRTGKGFNKWS